MINVYLGGASIESVRESFCVFELFLALVSHFCFVCRFLCLLLVLRVFLLLDDLFVGFWSSSCATWGIRVKIQTLCFLLSMDSSRGRLRNQVVSTLV
jgi:hypothetical protein